MEHTLALIATAYLWTVESEVRGGGLDGHESAVQSAESLHGILKKDKDGAERGEGLYLKNSSGKISSDGVLIKFFKSTGRAVAHFPAMARNGHEGHFV